MPNALGSMLRQSWRKPPYNCLSFPTHERYQSSLSSANTIFYLYRKEGIKDWNEKYGKLPANYHLLNPALGDYQLPADVDFDFVLSQTKHLQNGVGAQIAKYLQIPQIVLEHTLPMEQWPREQVRALTEHNRGHINIYISEYSRDKWLEKPENAIVIHHGVDTNLFFPSNLLSFEERKNHCLSVVNDWINRDWCCGFSPWKEATQGLPVQVVGDTPGLSQPANNVEELVSFYQTSRIFVNTSLVSPVPTALLEAMSCGCACVALPTCMVPEVIKHGENGFLAETPKQMREFIQLLLCDVGLAEELGKNARKTIVERFNLERFVQRWNEVFEMAVSIENP
jgi:glycosyltransferase involved in cell wall biosynthesis